MSYRPPEEIRQKLLNIAIRSRPIHSLPGVVLPAAGAPLSPALLFSGETKTRVLELGSGWGEFCVEWMVSHPDHEYLAMEIKGDRIRKMIRQLDRCGIEGVRICPVNFNWFLEEILPPRSFDLVIINFPDPWPKRRHWKHRLVDSAFPGRIRSLLREEGEVYMATDYGPYARRMLGAFRKSPLFEAVFPWPHYMRNRPEGMPPTRFESMHLEAGLRPYYQRWRLRRESTGDS